MTAKLQRNYPIPTKRPENFSIAELTAKAKKVTKKPLLDLDVNKSARPVITGVSKDILDLYKLRDNAASVLPNMGVCRCGKIPYRKYITVSRNEKGIKRFGNVVHCGSVWVCPTCAYKKTMIRQEQIREIIKLHNNSGCSLICNGRRLPFLNAPFPCEAQYISFKTGAYTTPRIGVFL